MLTSEYYLTHLVSSSCSGVWGWDRHSRDRLLALPPGAPGKRSNMAAFALRQRKSLLLKNPLPSPPKKTYKSACFQRDEVSTVWEKMTSNKTQCSRCKETSSINPLAGSLVHRQPHKTLEDRWWMPWGLLAHGNPGQCGTLAWEPRQDLNPMQEATCSLVTKTNPYPWQGNQVS